MFKFRKIRTKLIALIGLVVVVALVSTIVIVAKKSSDMAKANAFKQAEETANRYGMTVKSQIDEAMSAARTTAQTFEAMKELGNIDRKTMNEVLKNMVLKNDKFIGVWTCWEPNALDGKDAEFSNLEGHDSTGRFIPYWSKVDGKLELVPLVDYDIQGAGDYYLIAKETKEEVVLDPYYYEIGGKDVLITSLVVPIIHEGKFVGVAGLDIALDTFQDMIKGIKPFETGYASLISNNGIYVGHADNEKVGTDLESDGMKDVMDEIQAGEEYSVINYSGTLQSDVYRFFVPINIGKSITPWSFAVNIPMGKVMEQANDIRNYSIIIGIISIIIIFAVIYIVTGSIVKPINSTIKMLKDIAEGEGDLTKQLDVKTNDEIQELAKWFNVFVSKIRNVVENIKNNTNVLKEATGGVSQAMNQANQTVDEVAKSINTVSESVQQNASIVEETNASIEEVSNTAEIIYEESEDAYDNGKVVLTEANEGAEVLDEAVKAIEKVEDSTENVFNVLQELKVSSNEISQIISIMTEITEQTNLLALNAAIEAARAGDAGKGFAVVAEEVRQLAEESKKSADKIVCVVKDIQQKTEKTDLMMKEEKQFVETSVEKVNDANYKFNNILKSIKQVSEKIQLMSKSSGQQSQITSEMTSAMESLSAEIQNNASASQEVSASVEEQVSTFEEIGSNVEEINSITSKLKEQTDKFKV